MTFRPLPILTAGLLLAVAAACNPFSRFTNQYRCQVAGEPEPRTPDDYIKRASEHTSAGANEADLRCALGACEEAIRLAPEKADAYYCRAFVLGRMRKYPEAVKNYDEAINLQPGSAVYYMYRGIAYNDSGDVDRGLQDFDTALKMANDDALSSMIYAARAQTFRSRGKLDEAIQDYTQAIRLSPDSAYKYSFRGDLYFEKGDYQQAVNDYGEAIRIDSKNKYFYEDRAKAYRKLGREDLAAADEANARAVTHE